MKNFKNIMAIGILSIGLSAVASSVVVEMDKNSNLTVISTNVDNVKVKALNGEKVNVETNEANDVQLEVTNDIELINSSIVKLDMESTKEINEVEVELENVFITTIEGEKAIKEIDIEVDNKLFIEKSEVEVELENTKIAEIDVNNADSTDIEFDNEDLTVTAEVEIDVENDPLINITVPSEITPELKVLPVVEIEPLIELEPVLIAPIVEVPVVKTPVVEDTSVVETEESIEGEKSLMDKTEFSVHLGLDKQKDIFIGFGIDTQLNKNFKSELEFGLLENEFKKGEEDLYFKQHLIYNDMFIVGARIDGNQNLIGEVGVQGTFGDFKGQLTVGHGLVKAREATTTQTASLEYKFTEDFSVYTKFMGSKYETKDTRKNTLFGVKIKF